MEKGEPHMIHDKQHQQNDKSAYEDTIMPAAATATSSRNQHVADFNCFPSAHTAAVHVHFSDDFEKSIEASMDDLEYIDIKPDHETDAMDNDQLIEWKERYVKHKENRERTTSSSTDTSFGDDADNDGLVPSPTNSGRTDSSSNPFRNPEAIQQKILFWRPLLIPYQERRRLSQCKEEDETIIEESPENRYQIRSRTSSEQAAPPIHTADPIVVTATTQISGTKHKFIVTKTEDDIPLRPEADRLRHMTAKQNAATIHFPCSSSIKTSSQQRPSLNSLFFSPDRQFSPHLDKRFFDTSLVEIRAINSTSTLDNQSTSSANDKVADNMVWLPRPVTDRSSADEKNVVSFYFRFFILFNFFFMENSFLYTFRVIKCATLSNIYIQILVK